MMSTNGHHTYVTYVLAIMTVAFLSPQLVGAGIPDADINYHVKDALHHDPRTAGSAVTAVTTKGIVTLSGSVDNLAAKTYAVAEAKKINGVLGVIDKITVTPTLRSDTDISNAIRRRILNSAVIDSQNLMVTSKDGIVSISGTVASYPEEVEAELLASQVGGVKEVKNNIHTKWSSTRNDLEIKNDVIAALAQDVYLTNLPIVVAVQDGVVTLSGSVGNLYEKDRAFRDVHWISNVQQVINNLTVEWYENRGVKSENAAPSDELLRQTVRKALDQDTRLDAKAITIRTLFGEVTLDGLVHSHHEKGIAEQDAKNVIGAAWVTNNLLVQAEKREDLAIEGDIDFNLDTDAVTEGFDLGVKVKNGIAILTGKVNTWYQSKHAADIASRVRGVQSVINNLTVAEADDTNGGRWKKDAELVNSIKSRLRFHWTTWFVADKINVTVRNGVVTMEGDVNSWKQRIAAGELALHTSGISEVDNRLTVKGVAYPWDEHHIKISGF